MCVSVLDDAREDLVEGKLPGCARNNPDHVCTDRAEASSVSTVRETIYQACIIHTDDVLMLYGMR